MACPASHAPVMFATSAMLKRDPVTIAPLFPKAELRLMISLLLSSFRSTQDYILNFGIVVSLSLEVSHWEGQLVDISLHIDVPGPHRCQKILVTV